MSRYFEYFPLEDHTDAKLVNITLRSKLTDFVRANPNTFLPYVVEDGMRPEDVAYYYYDSVDYTWLIFLSNNIIDPYYDWPMADDVFHKYLAKKYYNEAFAYFKALDLTITSITDQQVLEWTMNYTIDSNIVEYRHITDENLNISVESYNFNANNAIAQPTPVVFTNECGIVETVVDPFWALANTSPYVPTLLHSEWLPVRVYDWEFEQNENKRHIVLVDKLYLSIVTKQLKDGLNER